MRILGSLIFLLLLSCFSCNNDDDSGQDTPNDSDIEFIVLQRLDCWAAELYPENEVNIHLYNVDDRFDFTNKTYFNTLEPNSNGRIYSNLEDGYYYFEVESLMDGAELMNGIFSIPEHLSTENVVYLKKSRRLGRVFERLADDSIGDTIPGAQIIHTHQITGEEFISYSTELGGICTKLNQGKYHVRVIHEDFEAYDSGQGVDVYEFGSNATRNYFLKKN